MVPVASVSLSRKAYHTELGPTLFNVYVSHIPDIVKCTSAEVPSYADDLTVLAVDDLPRCAIQNVSATLNIISADLQANYLTLNMLKSCGMIISRDHASLEPTTCNGEALRTDSHTRLLGSEIDDQLSWEHQVRIMSSKICKKIGALRRAKHHLSPRAKHLFLSSVILPYFDYACASFPIGLSSAARKRLAGLERRAVRTACGAGYTDDCQSLYDHLKVTSLEERWCAKLTITAYQ